MATPPSPPPHQPAAARTANPDSPPSRGRGRRTVTTLDSVAGVANLFTTVFRSNPAALIITRRDDGTILEVNERWLKLYGFTRDEVIGRTTLSLNTYVDPSDRERVLTLLREQGHVRDFETRIRTKSGQTGVVTAAIVPFEVNREGLLVTMLHDVTELRAAEAARAQATDALRQLAELLEQTHDAVLIWELGGPISYWNRGAEELYGYTKAEVIGKISHDVFQTVHPDGVAAIERVLVTTGRWEGELSHMTRAGRRITVESRHMLYRLGERTIVMETNRDITHRKRVEQRLRFLAEVSAELAASLDYEEALARLAPLAAPDFADYFSVYVVQPDGSLRLVARADADPALAALMRDIDTRYHPGPHLPSSYSAHILQTGRPVRIEAVAPSFFAHLEVDADLKALMGRLSGASLLILPLLARGQVLGTLSLVRAAGGEGYTPDDQAFAEDLSRRIAVAIDNARLYQDAQRAIRVRDEFMSIASHELKTPLTSLQMQTHLLLRYARQGSLDTIPNERLMQLLTMGDEQVKRLTDLVSDLLDVSRIEAGRLELARGPVDLVAIVKSVVERTADVAAAMGSAVSVQAPERLVGNWDGSRLDQVVTNLLTNAIKYGKGQPIELTVAAVGDGARLVVRDEGIGIPPDRLASIFERFERAVQVGQYSGIGLGLYISRQIVEAHGGTIRVASAPNAGAMFTVDLPLTPTS